MAMNVLLAVDGSESSRTAVEAMESRPWPEGTNVRVLYVIPSPVLAPPMPDPPPALALGPSAPIWPPAVMEMRKEFTDQANALVARVAHDLQAHGLQTEQTVHEGDPRAEIVEEAKRWPADLIVVGSHGYTGLKRWLLGSVAQSVVSHAPCSVEVVRKRAADKARS
jgi:nucleotide-binding universal stress UspA family protein